MGGNMRVRDDQELEAKIHLFMDRKLQKFPELRKLETKRESTSLLTRVQDFVAIWPHAGHPRHSH